MRKKIFNLIKTALSQIEQIKEINLYNQQLQYIEGEQPFFLPAVFIEFKDISWQHLHSGVKEATIDIYLHVVSDSRVGEWSDAINAFSLLDEINKRLFLLGDRNNGIGTLTLKTSITDHNFDELSDNIEVYSLHVIDNSYNE